MAELQAAGTSTCEVACFLHPRRLDHVLAWVMHPALTKSVGSRLNGTQAATSKIT